MYKMKFVPVTYKYMEHNHEGNKIYYSCVEFTEDWGIVKKGQQYQTMMVDLNRCLVEFFKFGGESPFSDMYVELNSLPK